MNRAIITTLAILVVFLSVMLFKTSYNDYQPLREGNEQIYKELTDATNLILFNTDIMMRFSHYQNNHDPEVKKEILCPECVSPNRVEQRIDPAWIDLPEDEEIVYRLKDAVSDNKEIFTQIQRLTSSLTNQHHKLKYTLLKMKYSNSDEEEFQEDRPQRRYVDPNSVLATFKQKIKDKDGTEALKDFYEAIETNIRPELHTKLAPLVVAIRYAENGGTGREYGVLHPSVEPTYRSQAGWCAATVQKNWDRYTQQEGDTENFDQYIAFLANRYCPTDDPRDTMELNKNWNTNVQKFYKKFSR